VKEKLAQACAAAGCDGYIAKPMRYQEFLATIAAQLDESLS
jgi:DNA-binding response OmpR family regulator